MRIQGHSDEGCDCRRIDFPQGLEDGPQTVLIRVAQNSTNP